MWKKLGKSLLFPHMALLLGLLPVSGALLAYSMRALEPTHPLCLAAYVLAFYTLTIWCLGMPRVIGFFRRIRRENPYVRTWLEDPRLRTNVTLTGSVVWNGAYAALQLGLGIYHRSPWFYSLAAYYTSLAVTRLFLVRHTLRHGPGEDMRQELRQYRACGWVFLVMNTALSAMIFYMIYENRAVRHHEITTITMAAYTFTSLTLAIVNVVRYRKYNSPAMSASKAISLAAACVSMLTLENTMLATFSGDNMPPETRRLFLALSGAAISAFIILMAIYMIRQSSKKLKHRED